MDQSPFETEIIKDKKMYLLAEYLLRGETGPFPYSVLISFLYAHYLFKDTHTKAHNGRQFALACPFFLCG